MLLCEKSDLKITFLGYLADATDAEEESHKVHVSEVDEELLKDRDEHPVLLCRARHNGIMLAGALIDGKCFVSLAKEVKGYDRYDVLRNVQNAARLQWRQWDQFNGRPYGAVSAADDGKIYIARRQVEKAVGYRLSALINYIMRLRSVSAAKSRKREEIAPGLM